MEHCTSICLISGCRNEGHFFTDPDKKHTLCVDCISLVSSINIIALCQHCQLSVACYQNVRIRIKIEPEPHVKPKILSSKSDSNFLKIGKIELNVKKCGIRNCIRKGNIIKGCGHFVCDEHLSKNNNMCPCKKCIYCNDPPLERPCGHLVCLKCEKISSCKHLTCKACFEELGFCVVCYPNSYCILCKRSSEGEKISCDHKLCKDCGIRKRDEHYLCKNCSKKKYMHEGECLLCSNSVCSSCENYRPLVMDCKHGICKQCQYKNKKCKKCFKEEKCDYCEQWKFCTSLCALHFQCFDCLESASNKPCLICSNQLIENLCSYCLQVRDIKTLPCLHKTCVSCNNINHENYCEICIQQKCYFCKKPNEKLFGKCEHRLCEGCNSKLKNQECIWCNTQLEGTVCGLCQKDVIEKKCSAGLHGFCRDCEQKLKNLRGNKYCIKCFSRCDYCKENSSHITKALCGHLCCNECYLKVFIKGNKKVDCGLCKEKIFFIECESCKKLFQKHDINTNLKCEHNYCYECCQGFSCIICEVFVKPTTNFEKNQRNSILNQKSNKDHNLFVCFNCHLEISDQDPKLLCKNPRHLLCENCLKIFECIGCLKEACQICEVCKKSVKTSESKDCGHILCETCGMLNCSTCNSAICLICKLTSNTCTTKSHSYCASCKPDNFCSSCQEALCESCLTSKSLQKYNQCGHQFCLICQKKSCDSCKSPVCSICYFDMCFCPSCALKNNPQGITNSKVSTEVKFRALEESLNSMFHQIKAIKSRVLKYTKETIKKIKRLKSEQISKLDKIMTDTLELIKNYKNYKTKKENEKSQFLLKALRKAFRCEPSKEIDKTDKALGLKDFQINLIEDPELGGFSKFYSQNFLEFSKVDDVRKWKYETFLQDKTKEFTTGTFSAKLNLMVTGSKDCAIRLWNPATLAQLKVLIGHKLPITALVAYKSKLYSGSQDGVILLWNLRTYTSTLLCQHSFEIFSLHLSLNSYHLYFQDSKGSLFLLKLVPVPQFKEIFNFKAPVEICKLPDAFIVSNGKDLIFHEINPYQNRILYSSPKDKIAKIKSLENQKLIFTTNKGIVNILEINTGKVIKTFKNIYPEFLSTSGKLAYFISSERDFIVEYNSDQNLRIKKNGILIEQLSVFFNFGEMVFALYKNSEIKCFCNLSESQKSISSYEKSSFSADSSLVAYHDSNNLTVYDLLNGSVKATVNLDQINSVLISKDNKYILSVSNKSLIQLWEVEKNNLRNIFKYTENTEITCMDLSNDSKFISFGTKNSGVIVFELSGEETRNQFKVNEEEIKLVALSPSSTYLVSYTETIRIILWNLNLKTVVWDMKTIDSIEKISFSEFDDTFFTGGPEGVKVWDLEKNNAKLDSVNKIWDSFWLEVDDEIWKYLK